MKFCMKCGAQIRDGDQFCMQCGTQTPKAPPSGALPYDQTQVPPQNQNIYGQPPLPPYYPPYGSPYGYYREDKVGPAPMTLGILGVVFALLIPFVALILSVIGLVLSINEINSGKTTRTTGRTLNIVALALVAFNYLFVFFMMFAYF